MKPLPGGARNAAAQGIPKWENEACLQKGGGLL